MLRVKDQPHSGNRGGSKPPFRKREWIFKLVCCHLIWILSPLVTDSDTQSVCLFITAAGLDVYQFTCLQTSWNININPLIQAFLFCNGCCAILCRYDMVGLIALKIFETAFKHRLATQTVQQAPHPMPPLLVVPGVSYIFPSLLLLSPPFFFFFLRLTRNCS